MSGAQNNINQLKLSSATGPVTAQAVIENLASNIDNLGKLKEQFIKMYVENNSKLQEFAGKLKTCKYEHSKKLYGKKVRRYQANCMDLLFRCEKIDVSIRNMTEQKDRILAQSLAPATEVPIPVPQEAITTEEKKEVE